MRPSDTYGVVIVETFSPRRRCPIALHSRTVKVSLSTSGPLAWGLCLALLGPPAQAAKGIFGYEQDAPNVPDQPAWQEELTHLPPYPRPDALSPVAISTGPRDYRYAIDAKALSVGGDGVVRYTVVIESSGGARNVLFEGIRCRTREYKTYAYGRNSGRFRRTERPSWRRIQERGAMAFRDELARAYLCDGFLGPLGEKAIRRRLARSGAPAFEDDESYGF